ncbi:DUF6082 family protein [Micromonospora rubida]|uniref:DUF6082 family protein n=1 Tax=Micromonospora rubida TaxID=2697657 RepID=UPI0038B2DDB0
MTLLGSFAIVLSPFLIGCISDSEIDWFRLADVGQAYGSVSVLVSALALVGIVATSIIQSRQMRIALEYAQREQHALLLRMAMEGNCSA